MRRRSRALLLSIVVALAAGAAGCASAPKVRWPTWLGGKKPDEGPQILTPRDKLEQLRELAVRAPKISAEDQQRLSAELAQAIPHEQDPILRAQILRTLAAFPTESAARILTAGLDDTNRDVRIAACDAWALRGGPEATTELARTLAADADIDVRLAAARGLGKLGHPSALAPLGEALEDNDPAMQRRAMLSLKRVTGRDYGNDVGAWREFVKGREPPKSESLAQRWFRWF